MAADGKAAETCNNCSAAITKVCRCSVCKKATYCSAACQKEDWRFHKRVCKKPEEAPADPFQKRSSKDDVDPEEMKRQMEELTKGQDPALAKQVQSMMAGMMGVDVPKEPEKPPEIPCQNCNKVCEKVMRCGVCKSATYCSAQCQKDDWRFHKRICQKPAAAPAPAAPQDAARAEAAVAAAGSREVARPKENENVVEDEDVGTWYKHREWKPQEARKEFTPAKVEPPQGSAAEAATAGSAVASSSWNAAGTWEEKNMLPWWEERLQRLQGFEDGEGLQVDSVSLARGEASIVRVRGQPKFMYDVTCELAFSGLQRCKPCSKSPPGSRCSNCMRVQGKMTVADFNWACEGDVSLPVKAEEPPGPSHVKKAGQKECAALVETKLAPAVRDFLNDALVEYKALVASDGPKWASQLPPVAALAAEAAHPEAPAADPAPEAVQGAS